MSHRDIRSRYFQQSGPGNTEAALEAAQERVLSGGITTVIVPSCTGETALRALNLFTPPADLIVVTHAAGFVKPGFQELRGEIRQELESRGVRVLTCLHAFGGVGRGIRKQLGTYQVEELLASTLRTFGQGTKVAVEIALMAADAGLVRTDRDAVCLGGTVRGIDTALLIRPANTSRVFDLKIREIICKPSDF